MTLHPGKLADIAAVSREIRDILGDAFDDVTFCDTLDGCTDAMDIMGRLIRQRHEEHAQAAAMATIKQVYAAREAAAKKREAGIRTALARLLDAMGQAKVKHPEGTVYFTPGRTSLHISQPSEIPSQLCKLEPDAAAIKAQLEAGEKVPGAELVTGGKTLNVRSA